MHLRHLIFAAASLVFVLNGAHAQQVQKSPAVTGLALEIVYLKGRAPAYQTVPSVFVKRGGAWYGLFGRVTGWQLPSGTLPVGAVRIVPYLEGETINIEVSVLRGEILSQEDKVASYKLRENEHITVTELKGLGVEPFQIKVVRVAPAPSDSPVTISKIRSLEVVGVEAVRSTFPRFKLTLHNLADKNISALWIHVMGEGKVKLTGMRSGDDGKPLIKAGDFCEVFESLAVRAQTTADGYAPSPPLAQEIVIVSVMYEDGTYEGETEPAATYLAVIAGNKIELQRIVQLLESALSTVDSAGADTLRAQLTSFPDEVADKNLDTLAKAFPGINRQDMKTSVEVAINQLKKDVLDQLQRFLASTPGDASEYRIWLTAAKERYADWLSRVNAVRVSKR